MTSTDRESSTRATDLDRSTTRWRALLLAAVAACAACGIVYELALLTLSASMHGGGIVATSLIVAGYVAALGVGALLVKPLLERAAITFIAVEALLGVIGGLSAAALYVTFVFIGGSLWVLVVGTALIGCLVGAEVPLLMTLLQRGRMAGATDSGRVLANLNAADYLGALIGGLTWPFILLPQLGMIRGAAATGMINLAAAAIVAIFLLRHIISGRELAAALCVLAAALGLLATLMVRCGRNRDDHPPAALRRPDHRVRALGLPGDRGDPARRRHAAVSRWGTAVLDPRRTPLHGEPRLSRARRQTRSALVLGGGDGLAARELLRQPGIDTIVQVELDPAVIDLARTTLRERQQRCVGRPARRRGDRRRDDVAARAAPGVVRREASTR